MSSGEHSGGSSGNAARWLAGILIGTVLSSLAGLGSVAMRHEGMIAADGARQDGVQKQLDRIERKIDRLGLEKP